ncbi:putative protein EXORDIUM [Helianthus annuus]|uniref:Phosphate-induced protein 1 n=1 Tax=Helianthus annuus TaxID=4232 RepID=A0A9K3HW75_HELAN|nr:protein EXORDIUM-like 3 [Helianthus annuus]KAF5785711.1 putative protein EXORDIUM [Helianthus annuus]KAJ0513227.1 putative protein EXORDIUM [Helianthus annuus]KAJ0521006.1 putative protein EXORDIUM [Helianthus annuus]KAJ0529350.1 putative protein EXORDIUM [Helianthus annuus]KAJ0696235.1 putative protein EXORDIUM [Helianthus annuus]
MTQMYTNSILLSLSLIGLVLIGNVRAAPSEQFPVVLKYHMGPVLSNNITVHLIWYGSWSSGEKRIIRAFINSISASQSPSPSVAQWWKALETYTDLTGSKVTQSVTLGQEKNDRLSHGRKLTRLAVQSVISTAIRAKTNPLPADPTGGLYLVLTSSDIIVEGFCRSICGFHYVTFPSIVGYTLPFAWVGNSEKMCPSLCAFPFVVPEYMQGVKALKPPNGQPGVDAMISVIGHELAELATNFLRNGWYAGDDPNFQTEVGDLCEGLYGRGGGGAYVGEILTDATGAAYNLNGYRRKFLVQWIYSNVGNRCVGPN